MTSCYPPGFMSDVATLLWARSGELIEIIGLGFNLRVNRGRHDLLPNFM